jgi:DNA-binding response OmpR family regulator
MRQIFMALPPVVNFTILLESPLADSSRWQTFVYEAKELIKMLNKFETKAVINVTDNFDRFLKILSEKKVDCFVFDWNYKECDVLALIGKIRKSNNFNKSAIIVLYDKKDEVDPKQYSALNINMAVTRPIFFENFTNDLNMYLEKKFSKLIPENYNVLLVDDEPDIIDLLESYIHKLEHKNIYKAKSVAEAKKLITETDFDLIFVDHNLGDGYATDVIAFARSFKDRKRLQNSLPIIVSGDVSIEDTMNFRKSGINDQIIKPFDFFEFQEKLTDALQKHLEKKNPKK